MFTFSGPDVSAERRAWWINSGHTGESCLLTWENYCKTLLHLKQTGDLGEGNRKTERVRKEGWGKHVDRNKLYVGTDIKRKRSLENERR